MQDIISYMMEQVAYGYNRDTVIENMTALYNLSPEVVEILKAYEVPVTTVCPDGLCQVSDKGLEPVPFNFEGDEDNDDIGYDEGEVEGDGEVEG